MAPAVLGRVTFRVALAVYAAGLVLWLTVGMLPILVDVVPAIADVVGTLAAGRRPAGRAGDDAAASDHADDRRERERRCCNTPSAC